MLIMCHKVLETLSCPHEIWSNKPQLNLIRPTPSRLHELAVQQGQEMKKIQFKDQSWLGTRTRSRDATLSRHKGININELALHTRIAVTPSGKFHVGNLTVIFVLRFNQDSLLSVASMYGRNKLHFSM